MKKKEQQATPVEPGTPWTEGGLFRRALYGALFLSASVVFSACGGCDSNNAVEEDKCEGIVCERGLCELATGECINPASCEGEDENCLEGYVCQDGVVCAPEFACNADDSCDRGECERGACVNPESCSADTECLENDICESGVCIDNPCADKTCDRGVCARTSGECVNAATCSEANEATQCIDGFKCDAQQCVSEADFCESLACDRGVCDFETKDCIDAPDCNGDDSQCLPGNFCNDEDSCVANECLPTGSKCMAGGECVRETGDCVNPEECSSGDDCLPMHACIAAQQGDSTGTCVESTKACGEDGCPGNQECVILDNELGSACEESDSCQNAIDCLGDRVCEGGVCTDAGACAPDAFEPNEADDQATLYADAQVRGRVDASICSGDTDVFIFDTKNDPDDTGLSTLLVNLDYDTEDVGLGALKVELVSPAGMVIKEGVANAQGQVRLEQSIGIVTSGEYTVRVLDNGDVAAAGIDYTLYMDVVDNTVITACDDAMLLLEGEEVTDTTISGNSLSLRSSCADRSGEAAEDIYRIDVTTASYVTVFAQAAPTADISVSLRSDCLSNDSELAGACSDAGLVGVSETVNGLVEPGSYFIVVQGADSTKGGSYTISWTGEEVLCTAADNSCVDGDTANVCRPNGTGFDTNECGASGCDPVRGVCNRPPGDVCTEAAQVDAANVPFTAPQIVWSDLAGEYDPGDMGCVAQGVDGSATAGADISYEVTVPANSVMFAALTPTAASTEDVSLYVTRDCLALDLCLEGVNAAPAGGAESLFWINDTSSAQSIFLVADADQLDSNGSAQLTINFEPIVCTPNADSCTTDPASGAESVGSCNETGTGFESYQECFFGCDATFGTCNTPPNDKCDAPIALTSGVPVSGNIDVYNNDHNVDSASQFCSFTSTSGGDAVYSITANDGDIITASVTGTFDTVLWASSDCDVAQSSLTGCLGVDNNSSSSDELVQFVVPSAGTYFIAVAASSSTGSGTFELTVTTEQPNCTPGQASVCDAAGTSIEYCNGLGLLETFACGGNGVCSSGACEEPQGELCIDAFPITSGVPVNGSITNAANDHGVGLECGTTSTNGGDIIYALDLQANDIVSASVDATFDSVLWASSGCSVAQDRQPGCLDSSDTGNPEEIFFVAPTTGRYYIAVAAWSSSGSGTYELTVDVQQPNCTPGQPNVCNGAGNAIEYCDSFGLLQTYSCGGNGLCSAGACENPSGQLCADAVTLNPAGETSGTATGTFDDDDNPSTFEYPAGQVNSCNVPLATDGADSFFTVELAQGDLLELELDTTSTTAVMYVLESCGAANSCLTGLPDDGPGTLYFLAPSAGTYSIVIDNSSTFTTVDFDLNWSITPGALCVPNSTECSDPSTVALCDETGLSIERSFACAGACVDGACDDVVATAVDACDPASPIITGGTVAKLNYDDLNNDVEISSAGCTGVLTDGPDAFFNVEVPAGEVLVVTTLHAGASFEDVLLYVIDDCSMAEATCRTGVANDNAASFDTTLNWYNNSAAPAVVTVGVDNESTTVDNDITVIVYSKPSECVPGQAPQCALSGDAIEYCNDSGLFERFDCGGNGVCSNGACEEPQAQYCIDALTLNPAGETSGTATGTFDDDDNPSTFEYPAGQVGGCDVALAGDGADTFFTVALAQGDLLELELDTTSTTAQMFVLDDCTLPASCQTGLRAEGAGTLYFVAPTTGTYSVVVDNSSTFTTVDFDLNWSITPGAVCVPNSTFCADGKTVSVCDASGLAISQSFACSGSCVDGACDEFAPSNIDACDPAAPVITSGTVAKFNFDDVTDDIQIPTSGCAGVLTDGPDAFFNVEVPAGEILVVRTVHAGATFEDVALYIIDDCAMADATCQAGVKQNVDDVTELVWGNTSGASVIVTVGVDNESTTVDNDIDVIIYTVPVQCTPNDPSFTTCNVSGTSLDFCDENGLIQSYACGGNGVCTGSSCEEPQGAYCFDQKLLNPSGELNGSESGSFSLSNGESTTLFPAGMTTGTCDVTDESDGADTYYSVSLSSGDVIELELDTTSTTEQIYVLGNCTDINTCLVNYDETRTDGLLYFQAPADGVYSIVVSNSSNTTTSTFNLNWRIIQGAICIPNQAACDSPNTVARCDDSGLSQQVYNCTTTCTDGACDTVAADVDVCSMATVDVGLGTIVNLTWSDLTNDLDLSSPNCTGLQTDGPDAFYTVTVPPGDILQASLVDGNGGTVLMYVVDDCATAASGNTCLAGVNAENEDLLWLNNSAAPATVKLAVDNTIASPGGDVTVEIRVRPSECSPGDTVCEVTGGTDDVLRFCNGFGLYEDYFCSGSCGTTTAGKCDVDSGDSCLDAIPVPAGGGMLTNTIDNFSNDYVVGSTCSTRPSTNGGDVVYRIDALAGDIITAEFASADFDTVLWVSGACDSLSEMGQCIDAEDGIGNGGETITFSAPTDGAYYIGVAAWSSSGSGDFTLDVSVQAPICTLGVAPACNAAGTGLEYCTDNGLALDTYTCDGNSCINDACATPSGDVCFDSLPIVLQNGAATITGDTTGLTGDHNVGSACSSRPSTNGVDVIYSLDLRAGDSVTASLDTVVTSFDTVLWASSGCAPGVEELPGCLDSDDGFSNGGETISFTAAADGIYYIGIAAWSATGSGDYQLDVTVQ